MERAPEKQGWLCSVGSSSAGSPATGIRAGAGNSGARRPPTSHAPGPAAAPPPPHGVLGAVLGNHSLVLYSAPALAYSSFILRPETAPPIDGASADRDAQTVLAGGLRELDWAALPLRTNPIDVCSALEIHIDRVAAERLASPVSMLISQGGGPAAAANVGAYVRNVARYPGLLLNSRVFQALQSLASTLGAWDDGLADQLKAEIASAGDAARMLMPFGTKILRSQGSHSSLAGSQAGSHGSQVGSHGSHVGSHGSSLGPQTGFHGSHASQIGTHYANSSQSGSHGGNDPIVALARSPQSKQLWLPAEYLLDPTFAQRLVDEVAAFHRLLWRRWSPISDPSLLFHASASRWRANPLVFDLDTPHFLGRLASAHALAPQLSSRERGVLLDRWIGVANALHERGDIVGWSAIACSICKPPILRLRDAWAFVSPQNRHIVAQEWGFEVFELEKRARIPVLSKRTFRASTEHLGQRYSKAACVPYFGDIIMAESAGAAGTAELERVRAVFEGWAAYVAAQDDLVVSPPLAVGSKSWQELLSTWNAAAEAIPAPTDAWDASLRVQPRFMGSYRAHFYTQQLPLSADALRPLLFTETTPSFRLFPRQALLFMPPPPPPMPAHIRHHQNHQNHQTNPQNQSQQRMRRSNSFPPAGALATGIRELELDARSQFESRASAHVLAHVVRDLLNVGAETIETHAGLVFKTFPNEDAQRRSSRASSVIESLGRRSMLLDSRRQSLQSLAIDHPRRQNRAVVVKAASLVRLVDVLVVGAAEFSPGSQLDASTHMATLLATYRSFCSPSELLTMLLRRVQGAVGAAKTIGGPSSFNGGVQWDLVPLDADVAPSTLRVAAQIVGNAIETLKSWVQDYFFDFGDDPAVMETMAKAIQAVKTETERKGYPESLQENAKRLTSAFLKQRYRVPAPLLPSPSYPPAKAVLNMPVTALEPDGGLAVIERFVEELDVLVADAFARISLPDWMKLFEVLELQTARPGGLFCYSSAAPGDDVVVQDIYSWMGTLYDPVTRVPVLDVLPPCVTGLFRLHYALVTYFARQLADPGLAAFPRDRSDRMAFVLKMLGVLRARMRFFDLFPDDPRAEDASDSAEPAPPPATSRVPAFLESVLISALLKPESRQFTPSWLRAGLQVAQQFPPADSAESSGGSPALTPPAPNSRRIYIPDVPNTALGSQGSRPITPCAGWLVERLAEIVCCVPNMTVDQPDLINFDKRRYAFNLVRNIHTEFTVGSAPPPAADVDRVAAKYAYLLQPAHTRRPLDRRAVKDALSKEFQGLSKSQHKQRVFADIVAAEATRQKLELRLPNGAMGMSSSSSSGSGGQGLHSGIPMSQSSSSLSSSLSYSRRFSRLVTPIPSSASSYNLSVNASSAASSTPSSGKSRSRLGGLLKAVRPLSMLGSSPAPSSGHALSLTDHSGHAEGESVVPDELPHISTLPALSDSSYWREVLRADLAGASVTCVHGDFPQIMIQWSAPQQPPLVLQAPSNAEAASWLDKLRVAVRAAAKASPRVFGMPLDVVCAREHRLVPRFFESLLAVIEDRGLEEVGLYRISGSLAAVQALRSAFDSGADPLADDASNDEAALADVNAVAGCVKLYLRELPEPLLTPTLFPQFVACAGSDDVVTALQNCVAQLPTPNRAVLSRLMEHLALVVQHEPQNKMGVPNLAIVFSMNFLPPTAMDQMGAMQHIVSAMITHSHQIFA